MTKVLDAFKIDFVQRNSLIFFLICFAFLLTQKGQAESVFYEKAQKFFSQSKQAVSNYLKTGKGLDEVEIKSKKETGKKAKKNDNNVKYLNQNYQSPAQSEVGTTSSTKYNLPNEFNKTSTKAKPSSKFMPKALYVSLLSKSIKDDNPLSPDYGISLGVSIPIYSSFSYLSSEFQTSGNIKNAGDWGQIQVVQKEALRLFVLNNTQIEVFYGMGLGFSHGAKYTANRKIYAPWMTGLQWSRVYNTNKVFYRFELGWTGDFYFSDAKYSQGLLANLSLGYKL